LLIIFDLDDTLIDTSGSITPIKLEHALQKMVEAGFQTVSFGESLELLRRLDQLAPSGSVALAEFIEMHDADPRLYEIGYKELYDTLSFDMPVFSVDRAAETLSYLRISHQLALVTIGKPSQQYEKMKKAGIDSTIFSKIVVTEEKNKKIHYQAIAEELGALPAEVLVCGDKIAIDLSPAKELGFTTVHMSFGRGKNSLGLKEDVDHTITSLSQIKELI